MTAERGYGVPRTDTERAAEHAALYGNENLPERGTGLARKSHNPGPPEKLSLRIEKHIKASGSTYDYVETDRVPQGQIWVLETIAYENETGARGTFRRYIERSGTVIFVSELQGPGAAELIYTDNKMHLAEGEKLVIRQASCTANDVLSLYITGYVYKSNYLPDGY
jgi:hypothetical protein